jgi:putative CocE/NonD family hydrolase
MKSAGLLVCCLSLCAQLQAQSFQFQAPPISDDAALSGSIRALALEVLSQKQDPKQDSELRNRFLLQLAVRQYIEAASTFASWRAQHPAQGFDRSILLEIYGKTNALEATEHLSFEDACRRTFATVFQDLDDKTALDSEYFLATPPRVFRQQLQHMLERFKDRRTLELSDAVSLIEAYLSTEAHQSITPCLGGAETHDDERRYTIDDNVLIKTREGATLSAVVVRRKQMHAPQPASLRFTIYVDPPTDLYLAKTAALHDYVGIVAYARGKRRSPDTIAPWEHEVQDTYGVIDWISRQRWSNGKVGMYGASYDGFAQWAAAKHMHPALKTIVPGSASFPGFGLPMQNNVFQNANYAWPFYVMDNRELDDATYNNSQRWIDLNQKWYVSGRPYREIDAIDGTPNPLLHRQMQHPSFDSYWQAMQPYKSDYASIKIPVLTITGYYDDANAAAVDYFVQHYRYNRQANHYLVIGPYPHASSTRPFVPPVVRGYAIDPVAQMDGLELTYQWFDHVMRDSPRPKLLEDRINFEVMGANQWRHAPSIDAMSSEKLQLYLTSEKVGEQYQLSSLKPGQLAYLEQTVDFTDRNSQNSLYPNDAIIDTPNLANGFMFVSAPFDTSVSMAGVITGALDIAINKRDLDITLALYELTPEGKLYWLSYYLGRASYANDMSVRKLLTPGVRASVPLSRTALMGRQMAKGSRLVVLVTVNKNAWAQVNYGTGKNVSDESIADAQEPLHVRWYNDSFVKIPIGR